MNEAKVQERLNRLDELLKQLLISLTQSDVTTSDLIYEYREERAELFLELTESRKLPQISDPVLRSNLKRYIEYGDEFVASCKRDSNENIRAFGRALEEEIKPEFNTKREQEVEWDLLFEWFNPSEYVYAQIELAPIILKYLELPEKLEKLVYELKQCIAFQNYLSAGIMLRTITEIAVSDILTRNYPQYESKYVSLGERLSFLSEKSKFSTPASILNQYRRDLNKCVHGEKLIDRKIVKQFVKIVFSQIEELYEKSDI
ncbi:MAG: hypothetical protein JJ895_04990 [Balneolaceae bacterium]|nr:hypothetical protein [Balneolaceae bacterium]